VLGDVSPAGRTVATWYEKDADLAGARGVMDLEAAKVTYRYAPAPSVAIPFGFGLSYSSFAYSGLTLLGSTSVRPCDPIEVQFSVANVGAVDADEVAQLYVEPLAPHAAPLRLANFTRVHVRAGASSTVRLALAPRWHAAVHAGPDFWRPSIVVPRGALRISVGGGQPAHAQSLSVVVNVTSEAPEASCPHGLYAASP